MHLTKDHLRVLKSCDKQNLKYMCKVTEANGDSILLYLSKSGYIKVDDSPIDDALKSGLPLHEYFRSEEHRRKFKSVGYITEKGRAALSESRDKRLHFWMPLIASYILSITAIIISILK